MSVVVAVVVVVAVDKRLHSVYTHSVESAASCHTPLNGIATFSQCVMQIAADAVIAAHYGQANVSDSNWEWELVTGNWQCQCQCQDLADKTNARRC